MWYRTAFTNANDKQDGVDSSLFHTIEKRPHQIDTYNSASDLNDPIGTTDKLPGQEVWQAMHLDDEVDPYATPINQQLEGLRHQNVNKMSDGANKEWNQEWQDRKDAINTLIGGADLAHSSMASLETEGTGQTRKDDGPKFQQGKGERANRREDFPTTQML